MYNGIGLTTPRGSGTNGYVLRNLSALRVHEPAADRAAVWSDTPPKHREPDQGILEHERKRKVEVKCLELQLELEENGVEEDKIEEQVNALREKLLKAITASTARDLRASDTHGLAAAKKVELARMASALGTRSDYMEGDAFDREKQEENRKRRIAGWQEKEKKREEDRARVEAQRARREAEKREYDLRRRREEDRLRKEREEVNLQRKERMPPPPRERDGTREIDRDRNSGRDYPPRRSPLPEPRRRLPSRSPRSRSPSPPSTRIYRRERSPHPSRRGGPRSRSMSRSRSRSPPRRRSPENIAEVAATADK